ncbi:hypothetical protein HY636_04070, partial [Candidatus Woesearchaeota archaeon]|nr:hypothetical protein [Candidatus Woesearchaeota archaeon]
HKLILISIFKEVKKGRDIKLNNSLRDVDLQENISCLNDWIEFHSGDIQKYENKMRKIAASKKMENPIIKIERIEKWKNSNEIEEKNPKTEGSFNFTKNFKPKSLFKFLIVCFVLALAIVGVYNLKPRITGLAAITEQLNYTSNINQEFYKSSEYTWNLDNAGDLRSIRIYGSKTKHGSANVYIENNEIRYLLLNSSELAEKESGIFGITGFAVKSDIKKSLKGELSEEEKEILELLIEDINTTRNNISIEIEAKKGEVSKEIKGNATYSQNYLINNLSLSLNGSDEKIQIKIEAEFEELAEENTAPLWNSNITNFTIDKTLTLNLSEYFYDADNDSLTYSSSSAPNVAAIIVGDVITIIPDETVNGTIQLTLAAFDGTAIGFQILSFDIKAKEFKEEINKTINISLDYGDNPVYDANNDGVETLTGVVDITPAKSAFSWEADEEKLCAKYEVYSFENKESEFACFGSNNCCNFLQLESSKELWNESLYLAYGSYGSTANNIVSAQVFFVDYNLSLENPYSEIAASSRAGLTAKFLEDFIQFEDVCLDTCFVYGFNSSSYKLVIEIDNATLRIDKIAYTIEKAAANETITNATNITNQAPALIKSIENISIASNKNYTLNLSQYFSDPDNDTLVYSYYKTDNLTILLENSIALIIPDSSFEGIAFTYIIANDSESSAASNVFMINVSQANLSEEIKPKVRVGKPVKWQKKILVDVSNVSSVNFTLPETASNISIKILNQTEQRELQDEKIKIIEDSKVKDKELFEL